MLPNKLPNKVAEDQFSDYKLAGAIAAKALKFGASLIKPGVKIVDVLDAVEEKIIALGGGIAFPAQISINNVAAHYCSPEGDESVFNKGDLVKLDVGAHINGCVGDNAVTVDLGDHDLLVRASHEARDAAIKAVKPGITPHELGGIIYEVITGFGFQPVRNLSGHGLAPYEIHTAPSIPNYPNNDHTPIPENHVIAIEPFATDGAGMIYTGSDPTIFSQIKDGRPRSKYAREVMKLISSYNGLPFTTRWISRRFGVAKTRFALKELQQLGIIHAFPPLPEKSGGLVSQSEHTVLVRDKPSILTKINED